MLKLKHRLVGLLIVIVIFSLFAIPASAVTYVYDRDDTVVYPEGVRFDTSHPVIYHCRYDGNTRIVLNILADAPYSGATLSTYPFSGGNATQAFETVYFLHADGYPDHEPSGVVPYGYPELAMNITRIGANPTPNVRYINGNNVGDMNIKWNGSGVCVTPRLNYNYNMYLLEDGYLNITGSGTGQRLIWARYSYSSFEIVNLSQVMF